MRFDSTQSGQKANSACSYQGYASMRRLGTLSATEQADFDTHLSGGCAACDAEHLNASVAVAALDWAAADEQAEGLAEGERAAPGLSATLKDRLLRRVAADVAADDVPADEWARPDSAEGVQVWKNWRQRSDDADSGDGTHPGLFTLASQAGEWQDTAIDGIRVKPLFADAERELVTMLVRMEAGTSYPPHRHAAPEECLVLEGDLQVAERSLRAGDYQRAEEGSIHGVQSTRGGCTLYITSSQNDELLPLGA